jgi:acetylornithine/N-succinyldiaminopimelate aminotransferase
MDKDLMTSTKELLSEGERSILFTTARPDVIMERGNGMFLWDTTGKQYLDFIGGWAVTCLGHCPPVITKALEQQSRELVNASPSFYNKPMIHFAKLLTESSCFDRVFFGSSGAEVNEGAIKLARKYGSLYRNGAYEIITTINSFHGRTLATMSATGKKKWESLFEPKVSGFKHVPLNDIDALTKAINPNTCAIMLEPIQGEGGVFEVEENYIKTVRNICEDQGILLIFDEVQTGIGRTGTLFAYEHYGIEPDIMTLAKGIGGGFPLAALLAKEKFNIFEAGDQGGTYSGQPLAMAVGMAVVKEVIVKDLATNAQVQGNYILKKLNKLKAEFNLKDIRGRGLLIAFDLPTAKGSETATECFKGGLIINSPQPSTIRLMPPLIVSATEIDDMLQILSTVLKRVL